MATYKTEQKRELIEFMKKYNEESFTIEELSKRMLNELNSAPGLSTIYRLMPKLVEEGFVKKFEGDTKRRFLYQIVNGEHCHQHLHMKCTNCGKLMHMGDEISKTLLNEVLNTSSFSINQEKTVLFGKCSECIK